MKFMLVAVLKSRGKADVLSPHLMDGGGEVDRKKLCASSWWLQTFLRKHLKWTWRASTSAAQSLPNDADTQIQEMLQRIAYLVVAYCIALERVFMVDETFAHMSPDSRFTYAPEGSKETNVVGKEHKLGVTVMVTSTVAGSMVPMQVIAKGATEKSLHNFTNGSTFTELGGGFKKTDDGQRRTCHPDKELADHPPYYKDPTSGHMLVAGAVMLPHSS